MKKIVLAISATTLACLASLAHADRHPDAAERAALDEALTRAGFVSWGEIELEKGYWDVDDARKQAGSAQKYDLKLDPDTLTIVQEKLDD